MPKKLQDYLFKINKPTPKFHFPTKNWILSGCQNPKTLSFAVGRNNQNNVSAEHHKNDDISAKLSDIDLFRLENFKSLYIKDDVVIDGSTEEAQRQEISHEINPCGILFESPRFGDSVPKLLRSNRFFVSPGVSGSLMEDSRTSMATTTNSDDVVCSRSSCSTSSITNDHDSGDRNGVVSLPDECVAVLAYSPTPYEEFRSSMGEMVEARLRRGESVDWGFVEELLFCYLSLNDKKSHKHILGAFVDLVVDLRRRSRRDSEHCGPSSATERSRNCRRRKLRREREVT